MMQLHGDKLSFEELMARKERVTNTIIEKEKSPKILKANKNATLEDFISMVAEVLRKTLEKHNAVFVPDEGAIINDPHERLEQSHILYQVISRIPKKELKPRHIESITEKIDDKNNRRFGENWSQRQECLVQFDVVACDYATANKVMNIFEDTIFTYAGYFKNNGVAEIYFKKYFTDKNLDKYRQWLSVRSIQYYVEIEKLITVFDTTIEDIDT